MKVAGIDAIKREGGPWQSTNRISLSKDLMWSSAGSIPNPSGRNRRFTLDALVSQYAQFRDALVRRPT
jgi:hypothetical protein